jgi:hypothetical protein
VFSELKAIGNEVYLFMPPDVAGSTFYKQCLFYKKKSACVQYHCILLVKSVG